jgi:hypothetical protein
MATKKGSRKGGRKSRSRDLPGVALEKIVAHIQQLMDPNSTVTHNEKLVDRVGNKRQYDVVIRGTFGGRPVLGVMECKDHSRKKGPAAIEAFAKKTENLNANLKLIVSKKGFTEQALTLARHEGISCLSLLPDDPKQAGFGLGNMWFGVIRKWTDTHLIVHFAGDKPPLEGFASGSVKWNGKPVVNWFPRHLLVERGDEPRDGVGIHLKMEFDQVRKLEIEGSEYDVKALSCIATRVVKKKKKWVSWTGDAFVDWHTGQCTIPAGGTIVGSAVETDLSLWDDYDGPIPEISKDAAKEFITLVMYDVQEWDNSLDVPDLADL